MTKVLIADAIKPSLVMSSEVFKDKIPGATVVVASTGKDAIEIVARENPDICLVDFDLPDVDGPALVLAIRKVYKGPILMTAYPDENVKGAVLDNLYAFNDASAWIPKPVRFDELAERIEQYLVARRRTGRRFTTDLPMQLVSKAAGRGKRAPKVAGRLVNISLGGALCRVDGTSLSKLKKKQEITLAFNMPSKALPKPKPAAEAKKPRANAKSLTAGPKGHETKIKATICWVTKGGQVGLQFERLSDMQLKGLEVYLKAEAVSVSIDS